MKELLTKKFWRDVKKTFDDARAETPPRSEPTAIPAPVKPEEAPAPAAPPAADD
jgi:hypothetical protein